MTWRKLLLEIAAVPPYQTPSGAIGPSQRWHKGQYCSILTAAGIVVNKRLNFPRREFDRLRATLTNCVRLGPSSQNRSGHDDFRGHLIGRISFVEMLNPAKGRRLRELFGQIKW